jgi:hypothetical protein
MSFKNKKKNLFCDIETFRNYFLIGFKNEKGQYVQYELRSKKYEKSPSFDDTTIKKIKTLLKNYNIITFNGVNYDIPIILRSLKPRPLNQLYYMSNHIITDNLKSWQTCNNYQLTIPEWLTHIDLQEPTPGVAIGLKLYGTRIHTKTIQDLPYDPKAYLTEEEMDIVKAYNRNDLDITHDLFNTIKSRIDIRFDISKEYNIDVLSKSDAQIAEAIVAHEMKKKTGKWLKTVKLPTDYTIQYQPPYPLKNYKFLTPQIQEVFNKVCNHKFKLDKGGSPILPDWLAKEVITIGDTTYKIGLGGLHSQEKSLTIYADDEVVLRNADVASYYPSMMLEYNFYPKHLGKSFLEVFGNIYKTRMKAKKGEIPKADMMNKILKIVLNGTFGKLGSKYSKVYAPDLLLQVTLTGQFLLLRLIETLEHFGVYSANTDGVEYRCYRDEVEEVEALIKDWERTTGMVMEHAEYKSLHARDVNSYVAVYPDKVKAKGVYRPADIDKNIEHPIVFEAVRQYLGNGTPLEDTIRNCKDVRQFLIGRRVTGGATFENEYLGKAVRYYFSKTSQSALHYVKNGNKVPKSDNSRPLQTLPDNNEIPEDLDYGRYVMEAIKQLELTGTQYFDEEF